MAYGEIAVMKEYGPDSASGADVRWTARFGADNLVQSYRGFKAEWHATPTTNPSLMVEKGGADDCGRGYASWNGATDVKFWLVYEGESAVRLDFVGVVPFRGFETSFGVGREWVRVGAVASGQIVRWSEVVRWVG